MTNHRPSSVPRSRAGFTMIEIMVSLVVGLIVVGGVYQLMIAQGRGFSKQREVIDGRQTSRDATGLLAWDVRHAASGGSPFAVMGTNTLTLRSPQGLGVICAKHPTMARYALWKTAGTVQATADDSALVYQVDKSSWIALRIAAVGTPAAMGVAACAWPGARVPDMVVELTVTAPADTSGIKVGAPFRDFRRVEYSEYSLNSRWWLGRKVGGATAYDQLTGPLVSPSLNGLQLAYYDSTGAVTANASRVASVAVTLRTESFKKTYLKTGFDYQRDSLTTRVAVRR
ncbi:MAG TPA: prepilin-type N-terminal cleavage/methylation domain-containing protein [Gemmatimonadaceae bacterium]|nr:prepilin-type N-terminal cleavage/methylation domain-containing protein [Gemmatimonadaceae bacterium]